MSTARVCYNHRMSDATRSILLRVVFLALCVFSVFTLFNLINIHNRFMVDVVAFQRGDVEAMRLADQQLRKTVALCAIGPGLLLLIQGLILVALRELGLGAFDARREARLRAEANQAMLFSTLESGERVSEAYLARPARYLCWPQLLVALLPFPLWIASYWASTHLAILAVLGYPLPPPELLSRSEAMAVGREVMISLQALVVGASFVLVRVLYPGGPINLVASGLWATIPVSHGLIAAHLAGGPQLDWRQFIEPYWWPGFGLAPLFLLLFVVDAWLYLNQRHLLFMATDSQVYVLAGPYRAWQWPVLMKWTERPHLVSLRDRPLGCELALQCGERHLSFSMENRTEAERLLQALDLEREVRPRPPGRAGFLLHLLGHLLWTSALYVWLCGAFVNVAHPLLRDGLLVSLRIVTQFAAYHGRGDTAAMRAGTDAVLAVNPNERIALYYRGRVLEDEGKWEEAATIYRRLSREADNKLKNMANWRLMRRSARA